MNKEKVLDIIIKNENDIINSIERVLYMMLNEKSINKDVLITIDNKGETYIKDIGSKLEDNEEEILQIQYIEFYKAADDFMYFIQNYMCKDYGRFLEWVKHNPKFKFSKINDVKYNDVENIYEWGDVYMEQLCEQLDYHILEEFDKKLYADSLALEKKLIIEKQLDVYSNKLDSIIVDIYDTVQKE